MKKLFTISFCRSAADRDTGLQSERRPDRAGDGRKNSPVARFNLAVRGECVACVQASSLRQPGIPDVRVAHGCFAFRALAQFAIGPALDALKDLLFATETQKHRVFFF